MKFRNTEIEIIEGDITNIIVDAIVNATNNKAMGGGGVDGAIHRAAGPELFKACLRLGGVKTGEAKITLGFNLPAKFIIHTAGPVYGKENGAEASYLEDCYKNSLALAEEKQCTSIVFPAIATGAYGFPIEEATEIAFESIQEYLSERPKTLLKKIIFVCFSKDDLFIYNRTAKELF